MSQKEIIAQRLQAFLEKLKRYYYYYYYSTYHFGKGPPRILSRHSRKQRSRGYYYTLHWYKASQYIRQYLEAKIHRGSYMSAQILLNLLNELEKRDKICGLPSILSLFAMCLINSITQEQEC